MYRKLLIAVLLLCGIALAQPPQDAPGMQGGPPGMHGGSGFGGPHRKFGPMMDRGIHPLLPPGRWWKDAEIVKTLGLSDSQVQKIEQIFQDSRLKLVDIHANLEKEEIKLEPLLEAENPDEGAVMNSIDRIAAARASLEKANAQMAFSIRRVLTPEQWKKLRSLRPTWRHFPPPEGGPRGNFERHRHQHGPGPQSAPPNGAAADSATQPATQPAAEPSK